MLRRSGSRRTSIWATFPFVTVKAMTEKTPPVRRHHRPGGAVDERGSDEWVELRVGGRVGGHCVRTVQYE